jgi:methionine-rich copper-binding protein CopC
VTASSPHTAVVATAAALAALLLALAATPGVARAHALYARSTPADGAVLASGPARVDMWTDAEMFRREGANSLTVTGPDGAVVNQGATQLDDADRTHLWVELQPGLRPGRYTVAWQTLSADDQDAASGTFAFTIDPTATPSAGAAAAVATAVATSTPAAEPRDAVGRGWSIARWQGITVIVVLLAIALIAQVVLIEPPSGEDEPR